MEKTRILIEAVSEAVSRGAVSTDLLTILQRGFSIPDEDHNVNKEVLLRIYSRRLRRCPPGSFLYAETQRLIDVLISHEGNQVKMIPVKCKGKTITLVLLESNNQFLFWSPIWEF